MQWITTVNQVSSAWFDNKLVRKSLHNAGAPNSNFRENICSDFLAESLVIRIL